MPGLTHWQHPRFFAYFPANSSPAAILGDLISSGIGAQGMIWATSPAVTEVEQVVVDWLAQALGLPEQFRTEHGRGRGSHPGHRVDGDLHRAARRPCTRASGGRRPRDAASATKKWAVYGSSQAHSSLVKAAMMAGVGAEAVRSVEVDPVTQAMDVDALERLLADDIDDGWTPLFVQAAVGHHLDRRDRRRRRPSPRRSTAWGVWLHVDAAWAGVAAVCPEHRDQLLSGVAPGRLDRHQPAQVAADDLRLQRALGARPRRR